LEVTSYHFLSNYFGTPL